MAICSCHVSCLIVYLNKIYNKAKMEKTNVEWDRQTLYKDAADSDGTVGIALCPSDKASKASIVSCQTLRAIASLLGTELAQPAAATLPFTQGQHWLWCTIGSNSAAS